MCPVDWVHLQPRERDWWGRGRQGGIFKCDLAHTSDRTHAYTLREESPSQSHRCGLDPDYTI